MIIMNMYMVFLMYMIVGMVGSIFVNMNVLMRFVTVSSAESPD